MTEQPPSEAAHSDPPLEGRDAAEARMGIKQVRSRIGAPADQKRVLDALGLRKMNRVVEHEETPSILGMVKKVSHLVAIVK